jgi:outer membrane protein assembly factor BamB
VSAQLAVGSSGYVYMIDTESGNQVWVCNLKGAGHGSVSLACVEGNVYAGSNGTAWGIDGTNGSVMWSNNLSVC